MRSRASVLTAAAAAAALLLAACSTTGATNTANVGQQQKKDLKQVTIGFAQRQLDAPYYSAMEKQAKDLAKQKGFKLLFQNAAGDPVTQIDQVNTMISQGANAIVVNAISPVGEKAQLTAAAKRVPLLFVDTSVPGVGFTAVQSDNKKIGFDSGALLAKRMGRGAQARIGVLNGGPSDETVGPNRQQGFLDGLKSGGVKVNVVAQQPGMYARDQAVPATESMLAAHPDINVILGLNDAMALGALSVLHNQNNTKVLVAAAADGQKEALKEIITGGCTGQYVSTGLNSPSKAGTLVFDIAMAVATGQKAPASYPKESFTQAAGIGCTNVKEFYDPNSVF